jgi:hypothetical protein
MEIQKYNGGQLPSADTIAINEGKGVQIVHADSVTPTFNVILPESGGKRTELSRDYFNLIIGYDPFPSDHILVERDRALTEYITDEVKELFCGWTPEKIEKIKKLPAIITRERDRSDEQQEAVFAFIKDVRPQENGIKVYFQKYYPIPLSLLWGNMRELAMYQFEFTRTHWTIKNIDLLEVLQDAGIQFFPGK